MRKLAAVSFSFSAAVFLCSYILPQSDRLLTSAACFVFFCAAAVLWHGTKRLFICLIAAGLCAGFLWTYTYEAVMFQPARELDNQTVRLSAVVTDYPKERDYGW